MKAAMKISAPPMTGLGMMLKKPVSRGRNAMAM